METVPKCSLCGKKFCPQSNVNRHFLSQHEGVRSTQKKRFKCNLCNHAFPREQKLIDHIRTHTGERPFKCTVDGCGKAFKGRLVLKNHIKCTHSNARPYGCNFPDCHYSAKTSSDLLTHKKVHSAERPFACPTAGCTYCSRFRENVMRHLASVHGEVKPFACSKCDYKTSSKSDLKTHNRRHSAKKDFKCSYPQCGQSFKSPASVQRHFSCRHEEISVSCGHPGCEKKYSNKYAMHQHKREVHSKKILVCPNLNCSYRANNSRKLARHLIIHEGRKKKLPCSVESCQYRGKNRKALESHMRLHKTGLACPAPGCGRHAATAKALKDHVKLHDPLGRPFQCPLCPQHFRKLHYLKSHCAVHTHEKPFGCGHCEYAASVRSNVQTHISSAHEKIQFPFIVHGLVERECLDCKVTLPTEEFLIHSMSHLVPTVMIERLETIRF